jgi:hypothetical protein
MRAPGVRRLEDISDGYVAPPVGTSEEVIESIRQAAPNVDASDPTWLLLEGPDHSIEVALGKGIQVRDLTFYIHSGEGAVAVILAICRSLAMTAYDTESGSVLTAASSPPVVAMPDDEEDEAEGGAPRKWWQRWSSGAG